MAKRKGSAADDVQQHIPGTHEKIPAVHDAALSMLDACRKTKLAKSRENACREEVRSVMEEEGIDEYEYGVLYVKIEDKKTPKVKMAKKQKADEGD
jgi:hypothetical protein